MVYIYWRALENKRYATRKSGGIKTGDASLKIWIGIGDDGFREDECSWMGKVMEQLYWEILVKNKL